MLRLLLSSCLLASISLILASPSNPVPRPEQSWLDRHESFVDNTAGAPGIPILFFGASIVDGWDNEGKSIWDSEFANFGSVNYGVGGDKIEHVHWRIINGEVSGLKPKLIVLHIGGNNISGGVDTDEEIVDGIRALVNKIRELLPDTKILLHGIFPRRVTDTFVRVANINIKISKLDDGNNIRFINMMDQFALGWGQINPEFYQSDSLHFVFAGYQQWNKTVSHLFHEMLE